MDKLIRFSEAQFQKVKKLIQKLCCNYYDGDCVLLDRNCESTPCPQLMSRSLICRYFCNAVLPNDPALYAQLTNMKPEKVCSVCSEPIYTKVRNVKYCPDCAIAVRRKKESERLRKRRSDVRILNHKK